MTENKQFKLKIIGDINDVDSEIILKDGGQPLCEFINIEDARLVKDLLNALHEEDEELKTKNNAYLQDIEMFKEENTTLKLENEQLKESKKELQFQLNICADHRNEFHRVARENGNCVGKLEKENKQLKEEIKDLNDILARYEEKELKE